MAEVEKYRTLGELAQYMAERTHSRVFTGRFLIPEGTENRSLKKFVEFDKNYLEEEKGNERLTAALASYLSPELSILGRFIFGFIVSKPGRVLMRILYDPEEKQYGSQIKQIYNFNKSVRSGLRRVTIFDANGRVR